MILQEGLEKNLELAKARLEGLKHQREQLGDPSMESEGSEEWFRLRGLRAINEKMLSIAALEISNAHAVLEEVRRKKEKLQVA